MTNGWTLLGAGAKLLLFLALTGLGGCMRTGAEAEVAGSGTELGNVMGILRAPNRSAAAGIEVQLFPVDDSVQRKPVLSAITDAEGAFAFKNVDGAYRLLAFDGTGNGVTMDSLMPSPSDTVKLGEVGLSPLGSLKGVVKSRPNGSYLSLSGTPFDTSFSGDADFLWAGIPAGKYWLDARQSSGMVAPASRRLLVTVVSGGMTELPDTLDLSTIPLELVSSQLPYRFYETVRPGYGVPVDSVFAVLNGARVANVGSDAFAVEFALTETMLDSTQANILRVYAHSRDSVLLMRNWSITWSRTRPVKWAYQAVRAVLLALEPDNRPSAHRPGPDGANPQRGTFRVLESRKLSPGELTYWNWPADAGGDSSVAEEIQATLFDVMPVLGRTCVDRAPQPISNLPGDTVTFFLLPDSTLGAWAFRLRTDERFEDLRHLGNFAKADWPQAESTPAFRREKEWHVAFRPEGLRIEWNWQFRSQQPRGCLATFRRFLVDGAGRVREIGSVPPGLDPDRLLLHYRAKVGKEIDADSLPKGGDYVYVDSAGQGVAGSADSSRTFQLSEGELRELKDLLSGLPDPIPADWDQEYDMQVWIEGLSVSLRYLASDGRGALYIQNHSSATQEKAGLFSRIETWLRERGLL